MATDLALLCSDSCILIVTVTFNSLDMLPVVAYHIPGCMN